MKGHNLRTIKTGGLKKAGFRLSALVCLSALAYILLCSLPIGSHHARSSQLPSEHKGTVFGCIVDVREARTYPDQLDVPPTFPVGILNLFAESLMNPSHSVFQPGTFGKDKVPRVPTPVQQRVLLLI